VGSTTASLTQSAGSTTNAGTITGLSTINGGTLANNAAGVLGDVTVAGGAAFNNDGTAGLVTNAGTLTGVGTLAGVANVAGGIVAPGQGIGTLNVAGNVSFAAGSIYQVQVNTAGQSDRIAATGTATLNGGTVQVLAEDGTYQPLTTYTILTAAGGVTGQFASVTTNYAFLTPTLFYDPTQVRLQLARNSLDFASIAFTPNQSATGRGVEGLGLGNPVYDAVLTASAPEARAAFDLLSGEIHATAITTAIETSRFVREAALNRLRGLGSPLAFAGGPTVPAAFAADLPGRAPIVSPVPVRMVEPRVFGLWGQGFGSWGRTDSNGNAARADRSTGGFLFGADATFDERWRVGFAGGYSRTTFDVNDRLSSGELESFNGAVYAGASLGAVQVRLGAAASFDQYETRRTVAFRGFGDTLRADYDGSTLQAFGELGYRLAFGAAIVEPFVGAAAVRVSTDGFAESGGGAALGLRGTDTDVGYTTLGVRAEAALGFGAPLFVRGMLGWRHAFGDTTPTTLAAFRSGSPGFGVAGLPVDRDSLVAEAGLDWRVSDRATIGISYTGAIGERAQDHGLRGTVAIRF
jgi:outer membrane autotransporter protein